MKSIKTQYCSSMSGGNYVNFGIGINLETKTVFSSMDRQSDVCEIQIYYDT